MCFSLVEHIDCIEAKVVITINVTSNDCITKSTIYESKTCNQAAYQRLPVYITELTCSSSV